MAFLTRLPLGPHICVCKLCQLWFRCWLVACSEPGHCLNLCWLTVKWTLINRLRWNPNQSTKLFIVQMHLEVSSAGWRPSCIGRDWLRGSYVLHWWGGVVGSPLVVVVAGRLPSAGPPLKPAILCNIVDIYIYVYVYGPFRSYMCWLLLHTFWPLLTSWCL